MLMSTQQTKQYTHTHTHTHEAQRHADVNTADKAIHTHTHTHEAQVPVDTTSRQPFSPT